MLMFFIIIALFILFYLLGKSAELITGHIKEIAEKFGVKVFFLGLVIGFLTSLPELAIGISSVIHNVPAIALGNLLGGILVLFGFVLGISAILNRKIKTDGKPENITLISIYIVLPSLIALDGSVSFFEGMVLILGYFFIIYHLYTQNKIVKAKKSVKINAHEFLKRIFTILIGLVLIIVISNIIIRLTEIILQNFGVSPFVIGLILFSLGTNLPEIVITIRSWREHLKDLSVSSIIGSAIANVFIVGLLAIAKTIPVAVNTSYVVLVFFTLSMLGIVIRFHETEKSFSRKEGLILALIYCLFLLTQIALL